MAAGLDTERLRVVFHTRPDLVEGIQRAADSPDRVALFNNITRFVYDQYSSAEPSFKRRRVDDNAIINAETTQAHALEHSSRLAFHSQHASATLGTNPKIHLTASAEPILLEIKDISLSIPQRKKFDLCFTKSYLYARVGGTTNPVPGIVYAWSDIEHVFYVPVPEKSQLQFNYVLFPRGSALAFAKAAAPEINGISPPEPLVFTVPATAPKSGSVKGISAHLAGPVSDSYSDLFHWAIEKQLHAAGNVVAVPNSRIVGTNPEIFHSVARQAHRPNEMAVHVHAFRGNKDGFLFFLPTGILWGFKKPLLFLPLDRIQAVSYTNVLQRTFNMVVEVDVSSSDQREGSIVSVEVEFCMLDQEDYGGIDEKYVRRHGLQDRSMVEQRRAKRELAENAREGKLHKDQDEAGKASLAQTTNQLEDDEEMTELQRTEMRLQDAEDELEEDYDPGSEGYSDGSGESSDGVGDEDDNETDDTENEQAEGNTLEDVDSEA